MIRSTGEDDGGKKREEARRSGDRTDMFGWKKLLHQKGVKERKLQSLNFLVRI